MLGSDYRASDGAGTAGIEMKSTSTTTTTCSSSSILHMSSHRYISQKKSTKKQIAIFSERLKKKYDKTTTQILANN